MKDYDAIVRADWNRIDDEERQHIMAELQRPRQKGKLGFTLSECELTEEELATHTHNVEQMNELCGGEYYTCDDSSVTLNDMLGLMADSVLSNSVESGRVDTLLRIKDVLKDFPNNVVDDVRRTIPTVLDKHFAYGGYFTQKYQTAILMRKQMNLTIKHLSGHILNIASPYPDIVKQPLLDALEMAKAYIKLLDKELASSRYKAGGEAEYITLTTHPVWNDIIANVVETLEEAFRNGKQERNYRLPEDSKLFSLTAQLMRSVYPWCWGTISLTSATKKIRERYSSNHE